MFVWFVGSTLKPAVQEICSFALFLPATIIIFFHFLSKYHHSHQSDPTLKQKILFFSPFTLLVHDLPCYKYHTIPLHFPLTKPRQQLFQFLITFIHNHHQRFDLFPFLFFCLFEIILKDMAGNKQKKSSFSLFGMFKSKNSRNRRADQYENKDDFMKAYKVWPSDEDRGRWVADPEIDRKASAYISTITEKYWRSDEVAN